MYPYEIIAGMDLYSILIVVGVVLCMIFIRIQADKRYLKAQLQNLVLMNTVAAVVLGYGSAVLFQAFYNFMAKGVFEIVNSTGSTFYGGLIGGTAMFIVIYFAVGHFLFKDGYHARHFRTVSDLAPAAITVAHGFGRLGCLMAGCCHGRPTDAWYGIPMNIPGDGTADMVKVVPVQLFEAVFLLALSGILLTLFLKGKRYQMPIYMIAYALWRFPAELMRNDYRGATVVDFLTPSQLISVLLLLGGIALLLMEMHIDRRAAAAGKPSYPIVESPVPAAIPADPSAESPAEQEGDAV